MKRWLSLAAAAAYLLQGLLLLPLHEIVEAQPHHGCEACVAEVAPSASGAFSAPHNHPLHDEGNCALCQAAHERFVPAVGTPFLAALPERALALPSLAVEAAVDSVRLPASRAPPVALPL